MEPENNEQSQPSLEPELSPRQIAFLAIYSNVGSITRAARACAMVRENHHRWMRETDAYRAAFKRAQQEAIVVLEDEAHRRAVEGEREPVFYRGRIVGHITRRSDGLLQFLLRANDPGKYGDKTTLKHTNPDGSPLLGVHDIRAIIHAAELERTQAAKELAAE